MTQKYVLVLWTRTKKTGVVSEEKIVKSYGNDGKEVPICEGALRVVSIGDHRYEATVLRISASKKFLDSLLVTKDGKVLLHGSKPACGVILAKRCKLLSDKPENQEKETNGLRTLNTNAEEQQPGTRLNSSDCSHGCPSCCSGTLPPFPTIPEGFVSTVVSLAEYFHQFHKSTIANILAAGHVPSVAEPDPWLIQAENKVELTKGSGVWVNSTMLQRILTQVESMKKPPHQTLIKALLTHLLGVEKYIKTLAEKIDHRMMSAVLEFVHAKYPKGALPAERYYKCINLNRAYLLRKKNEGALDDPYVLKQYNAGVGRVDGLRKPPTWNSEEEKIKFFSELEAKKAKKSELVIPVDSEISAGIPSTSNSNINKIIVVRRPMTMLSASDIDPNSSTAPSNFQSAVASANGLYSYQSVVVSSNQPTIIPPSVVDLTSANRPHGNFGRVPSFVPPMSSPTNQSIRSTLPLINQPNQLTTSVTSANTIVQPNTSSVGRKISIPTNRVLVSTPNRLAPANQPIVSSENIISKLAVTTTTSPSMSGSINNFPQSNKNGAFKSSPAPSGALFESPVCPSSQPNKHTSKPEKSTVRTYSKVPKASSPEIIEIPTGDENITFKPNWRLKKENNFEIEGALDISL